MHLTAHQIATDVSPSGDSHITSSHGFTAIAHSTTQHSMTSLPALLHFKSHVGLIQGSLGFTVPTHSTAQHRRTPPRVQLSMVQRQEGLHVGLRQCSLGLPLRLCHQLCRYLVTCRARWYIQQTGQRGEPKMTQTRRQLASLCTFLPTSAQQVSGYECKARWFTNGRRDGSAGMGKQQITQPEQHWGLPLFFSQQLSKSLLCVGLWGVLHTVLPKNE